ncbi:hypothetical protein JCM8097_006005 [Rhodosporidiobolus ruineniae]
MSCIPLTAPAVVFESVRGEIKYDPNYPVVQPEDLTPGEVLVQLDYSGVCHTDYHHWSGAKPAAAKFPLIAGHEGVGRVVAIGHGTTTALKPGSHVGLKWIASTCGECAYCRSGNEQFCASAAMHGFTRPGTFQRYVVADEKALVRVPEDVKGKEAAVMMCAGVTAWKAVKKANVDASNWLVISGAGGGIGHLATQFAVHSGIKVVAIDRGDKRELVEGYGVETFLDYEKYEGDQLVEEVKKVCGGIGAQAVIVASTAPDIYGQALKFLRPMGTLVVVAVPGLETLDNFLVTVLSKGLSVVGVNVGSSVEVDEALQLVSEGKIQPEVTVEKLEDVEKVFQRMEEGKIQGRVALE